MNNLAIEASTTGADPQLITCTNCGRSGDGQFCSHCGQKRFHVGDLGFKQAWHHLVHELLHLDGKIFLSLKSLFIHPGELTLDFIEGRRAQHVHPIRLFVVFLFLFFFLTPINPFLEISANVTRGVQNIDQGIKARLEARAARNGTTLQAVLDRVSDRLRVISKPVDLCTVIVNGLLLWALFHKRRRYLAENMTMALHLECFTTGVQLVVGWVRLYEPAKDFVMLFVFVVSGIYFLLASRRVYGESWFRLALAFVMMFVAQFLAVFMTILVVLIGYSYSALA